MEPAEPAEPAAVRSNQPVFAYISPVLILQCFQCLFHQLSSDQISKHLPIQLIEILIQTTITISSEEFPMILHTFHSQQTFVAFKRLVESDRI